MGHAFIHQRRITADKVYTHFLCCLIQSFCNRHKILRRFAGTAAYQRDRSNRNTLVYDRHTKVSCDLFSGGYQILCISGNFFVDFLIQSLQIIVAAVQKTDAHGNGTNIQLLMFDHIVGFNYFKHIQHGCILFSPVF